MKKVIICISLIIAIIAIPAVYSICQLLNINQTTKKTEVIIYTPKPGNYPQKTGYCWTSSVALQGRSGSLRCSVGNSIIDPCFNIDNNKVICDTNPLKEGDEFELILEEGDKFGVVYRNSSTENITKPKDNKRFSLFSWFYQLEDGSHCFLIQGTAGDIYPIGSGEVYYYVCDDNKVIIGDVDKSNDLWTAEVGYFSDGNRHKLKERKTQSVVAAWE